VKREQITLRKRYVIISSPIPYKIILGDGSDMVNVGAGTKQIDTYRFLGREFAPLVGYALYIEYDDTALLSGKVVQVECTNIDLSDSIESMDSALEVKSTSLESAMSDIVKKSDKKTLKRVGVILRGAIYYGYCEIDFSRGIFCDFYSQVASKKVDENGQVINSQYNWKGGNTELQSIVGKIQAIIVPAASWLILSDRNNKDCAKYLTDGGFTIRYDTDNINGTGAIIFHTYGRNYTGDSAVRLTQVDISKACGVGAVYAE